MPLTAEIHLHHYYLFTSVFQSMLKDEHVQNSVYVLPVIACYPNLKAA